MFKLRITQGRDTSLLPVRFGRIWFSSLGEEDSDRQTDGQNCSIAIDQRSLRWSKNTLKILHSFQYHIFIVQYKSSSVPITHSVECYVIINMNTIYRNLSIPSINDAST